jgi:hypothetical protein
MKSGKSLFGIAMFFMVAVMVFSNFSQDAQAFRGERGVQVGRGEREGGFAEGPRGGAAVEGPNGGVVVRGPEGNVGVGRAVGDRVAFLPDSATPPLWVVKLTSWMLPAFIIYSAPVTVHLSVLFPILNRYTRERKGPS